MCSTIKFKLLLLLTGLFLFLLSIFSFAANQFEDQCQIIQGSKWSGEFNLDSKDGPTHIFMDIDRVTLVKDIWLDHKVYKIKGHINGIAFDNNINDRFPSSYCIVENNHKGILVFFVQGYDNISGSNFYFLTHSFKDAKMIGEGDYMNSPITGEFDEIRS